MLPKATWWLKPSVLGAVLVLSMAGLTLADPDALGIAPAPGGGDASREGPDPSSDGAIPRAAAPTRVQTSHGRIQASFGSPTGHVIMGPTSENHAIFEAGREVQFAVAEVAWESDDIHDLGAVLFRLHESLGPVGEATSLDWEYVDQTTGPSPMRLAVPVEPDARYVWAVYPLPGQVIVDLPFESAMSTFDAPPSAEYGYFPP